MTDISDQCASSYSAPPQAIEKQLDQRYDLCKMFYQTVLSIADPILEYPEFCGPVANVWISKERGFGLVATRDISPGELLVASKAFSVAYSRVEPLSRFATKAAEAKEFRRLLRNTLEKVSNRAAGCEELAELFSGPSYARQVKAQPLIRGNEPMDRDRIASVLRFNSFAINIFKRPGGRRYYDLEGRGLWLLPSLINHSCAPNCSRMCFGNILLIRATEKIAPGDEITLTYISFGTSYEERKAKLLTRYGFSCKCRLCEADEMNLQRRPELAFQRQTASKQFDLELANLRKTRRPVQLQTHEHAILQRHLSQLEVVVFKNRYDEDLAQLYLRLASLTKTENERLLAVQRAWVALAGNENGHPFVKAPNVVLLRHCINALWLHSKHCDCFSSANTEIVKLVKLLRKHASIEYGTLHTLRVLTLLFPGEETTSTVEFVEKLELISAAE